MSTDRIELLDGLEAEFARVAAEDVSSRRRPWWRMRAVVAAAAMSLCFAAGATAAAVTGVFDDDLTSGLAGANPTVVATGTAADGSLWKLFAGRTGDSFCLSLRTQSVPSAPPEADANCGGFQPGALEATYGGTETAPFVFGTAPDEAVKLSLTARGESRAVPVTDDGQDLPGRFFVADLPRGDFDPAATVTLTDASGATIAEERLQELVASASPLESR